MRPLRPWREALSAMLAEWKRTDAFPSIRRL